MANASDFAFMPPSGATQVNNPGMPPVDKSGMNSTTRPGTALGGGNGSVAPGIVKRIAPSST